MRWHSYLEG